MPGHCLIFIEVATKQSSLLDGIPPLLPTAFGHDAVESAGLSGTDWGLSELRQPP
jgi:hypothetical protein